MSTAVLAAHATQASIPFGYLAGVVILTTMTLIALAPSRFSGLPGAVTYRLGLVVNELPFAYVYLHATSTVLVFDDGDIRSPFGWATVAAAALPAAGLAVVAQRGLSARPVIDRALRDGLGSDWRTSG